ncbi:MAG TPA: hypothetical protein VJQ57_09500 [Acidimicrobiia bacterium]|nr:hypothetical protein [Acidimicrobiia bacterium]
MADSLDLDRLAAIAESTVLPEAIFAHMSVPKSTVLALVAAARKADELAEANATLTADLDLLGLRLTGTEWQRDAALSKVAELTPAAESMLALAEDMNACLLSHAAAYYAIENFARHGMVYESDKEDTNDGR